MGKQTLGKDGQPIFVKTKLCHHGVQCDARGNNACEECSENGRTSSYLLGQAVTYENLVGIFAKRAGDAYASGNDESAKFFRKLSKEMEPEGEAWRKRQAQHDEDHPFGPSDEDPKKGKQS